MLRKAPIFGTAWRISVCLSHIVVTLNHSGYVQDQNVDSSGVLPPGRFSTRKFDMAVL